MVATGLDALRRQDFAPLRGRAIGLVANQASLAYDDRHALELLLPRHRDGFLRLAAVFGPQHGLFGHTQDNMIEWEGAGDARIPVPIHSLYGEVREPTDAMLEGVELLVIDLPDVGARYYTFVWTAALCLRAAARQGIPVLVLDRPNPIDGVSVEGTVQEPGTESFVGLHPLPMRHGMTVGEVLLSVRDRFYPDAELSVVPVEGWDRTRCLDEQDAMWAMPSPNMPTVDTALVYPGACLYEATNLSEGRGTTRPFEIVGAPWLDGWRLAEDLNGLGLPGVRFRPATFEPTFNKHAGKVCEGVFTRVTDRRAFLPVLTAVAVMQACVRQAGLASEEEVAALPTAETFVPNAPEVALRKFVWRRPPYEYERDRLPIDVLAGNAWLREAISEGHDLGRIRERMDAECAAFAR